MKSAVQQFVIGAPQSFRNYRKGWAALLVLTASFAAQSARAQAPYLLPYTIQSLAGGGTAPTVGATCVGANGVVGTAYDVYGDGCPITSGSVIVGIGSDIHDVVVDTQGNIFFIDNTSSYGVVRRIDARSGVVTVYAGSPTNQTVCTTTLYDKYGDGCLANDGKANYAGGYTGTLGKLRGIGLAPNGDLYIADYGDYLVHKVSRTTGLMTVVAGALATGTKPVANGGSKGYGAENSIAFNSAVSPPTGSATNAPRGVTVDAAGNIYIADSGNNVIRKVAAATGLITTIAGVNPNPTAGGTATATAGFAGDGNSATSSATQLNVPEDVEYDSLGNIYIADMSNARIRVIYASGPLVSNLISKTNGGITPTAGNIYTIVGDATVVSGTITPTPPTPSTTNPGPVLGTSNQVASIRKLRLDSHGNIFFADNGNDVIWFLDATTGYIRVIAGTLGATTPPTLCMQHSDSYGDNCPATTAALFANSDMGVTVDAFGNVLVTDPGNMRLRKVNTNQVFPATVVGSVAVSQILEVHFAVGDSPAATNPYTIAGVTDFSVTSTPPCTTNADNTQDCLVTVAFNPTVPGNDSAVLTIASKNNGSALINLTGIGTASTVAFDPGTVTSLATGFNAPFGIAINAQNTSYIADTANNRVVAVTSAGSMSVVAGTGTAGYTGDNALATAATLNAPRAVAVAPNGFIYIADTGNNVIRRINPGTGIITTIAGGATSVCTLAFDSFGDSCPAIQATFKAPAGLASDSDGNIYVSDSGNNLIREVSVAGYAWLVGGGTVCSTGDTYGNGCAATGAAFKNPTALQLDLGRNLYIADTGDNLIRKITGATGIVTAVAGSGQAGFSGNGGSATAAQINAPTGLAVDASANLYIADTGNSAIRLVNAQGNISTITGVLGVSGTGTVPGSAYTAQLTSPAGVASNGAGQVTILDSGNNRLLVDARGSVTYSFGRTTPATSSSVTNIQETNTGSSAALLSTNTTTPIFTATGSSGSFSLVGSGSAGCSAGQSLPLGNTCLLAAQFSPATTGPFSATFTESTTNTINSPAPTIQLSGIGAVLTPTTSTTAVTSSGTPQYAVAFTVTTTVTPSSCNTQAPSCTPAGTVSFAVDGNGVGVPVTLVNGKASSSINGLSVGQHTITTNFTDTDGFYASSTSMLVVTVAQGTTTTVVTANPATGTQFSNLVLTATVTTQTGSIPTGTVTFYAGTTSLGSASVNPTTGVATLQDIFVAGNSTTPAHYPQSFKLYAGTYALTAVYNGGTNSNYAPSTSTAFSLVIQADPATFTITLNSNTTGTAQGSTANLVVTVTPQNTFSGTMTFSCTNMPSFSDCTYQPTTLLFTPVPGPAATQQTTITIFTDVPAAVLPGAATLLGWPILLGSVFSMLAFRKRLRGSRLLVALLLFATLAGTTIVGSGCAGGIIPITPTPVGTYTINFVATGPNNTVVSTPISFTVTAGAPGQL